ncbi:hypothetical protein EASAB2608_01056 [Streptomyces sp. EAS-AB2608]|nr:hypothetical protein EASAB2608_01056 [Streptomyces sp. EAS-AB2608]
MPPGGSGAEESAEASVIEGRVAADEDGAGQCYDRKRKEGKGDKQAVIALARRRVDVLWAMISVTRPSRPHRPHRGRLMTASGRLCSAAAREVPVTPPCLDNEIGKLPMPRADSAVLSWLAAGFQHIRLRP